ncbi:hypothetical protein [Ulvibacterium sp.]|uniref:hypothetical protein n=1 Tax=Ulvibacterium sp. TaxID=2665914 RepID=UPI0026374C6E|nr:hypothetical protein [Ulvibacterium sp.]
MKVKKSLRGQYWNIIFVLLFAMAAVACSNSDDPDPTDDVGPTDNDGMEEPQNKSTGFVFVGTTSSGSALAKYVEELPTGDLDLSDGTDYSRFFPTALYGNALFMQRPDGSAGFSKIVVNPDGELEEDGVIPTISDGSFRMEVRDAELGVFHDRATPNTLSVFNPTTFEVTGSIDMSAGEVPGDIDQRYQRLMFRGDDLFAPIRGEDGSSFPSFVIHSADLSTNSYVGTTGRDGNGVSDIVFMNDFGQNVVDSQGNIYIMDVGNLEGAGIPARINKIPAGSYEVDPTYTFDPAAVLNPANTFLPSMQYLRVLDNDNAVALVNAETPQAAVDIVLDAGGLGNLTPDQINQILGILFTAESAVWCELDLTAQTVTPIEGVPNVGAFAGGTVFNYDGAVYLPVPTTEETAYYSWNPGTGEVTKAFTITGADLSGGFNIANNN